MSWGCMAHLHSATHCIARGRYDININVCLRVNTKSLPEAHAHTSLRACVTTCIGFNGFISFLFYLQAVSSVLAVHQAGAGAARAWGLSQEVSSVRCAPRDESVSDYRFTRSRTDRPSPRPIAPFKAAPETVVPPDWLIRSGAKGNQQNFPTACACWQAADLLPAAAWARRRWSTGKGGAKRLAGLTKIPPNWLFVEGMQINKACLERRSGELFASEREASHWLALLGDKIRPARCTGVLKWHRGKAVLFKPQQTSPDTARTSRTSTASAWREITTSAPRTASWMRTLKWRRKAPTRTCK